MSEEAVAAPATEAAAPAAVEKTAPEKYKVTVDGTEQEVDIDELRSSYSHVKASNERFSKAAQAKKEAESLRQEAENLKARMKSDPWSVMEELGLDPRTTSEEYLIKKLEFDALTPEQKKIMELEQKNKSYEEKEALTKKEREEAEKAEKDAKDAEIIAAKSAEFVKEYEATFLEALQKSTLPKNHLMVSKVAEKMRIAADQGWEMSPKQAVKVLEREVAAAKKALIDSLSPDELAEFLGDENLKKVRKRDVDKLRNPIPQVDNTPPKVKEEEKPRSPAEWLAAQKKKHGILT